MERAKCAAIECRNAPSVARLSKNAFSSTKSWSGIAFALKQTTSIPLNQPSPISQFLICLLRVQVERGKRARFVSAIYFPMFFAALIVALKRKRAKLLSFFLAVQQFFPNNFSHWSTSYLMLYYKLYSQSLFNSFELLKKRALWAYLLLLTFSWFASTLWIIDECAD